MASEWVWCLNPCCSGIGSVSSVGVGSLALGFTVLILVVVELAL